jgi:hypothetical protein
MAPHMTLRRRILAAALTIPVILGVAPALAHATTAEVGARTVSSRICDFDWRESRREVKRLIRCAARHWRSPGGANKALDIARCESGYNPDAYNPAGYAGVFQHATRYWPDRADRWGFPNRSVYNGRANVIVSIRMARSDGDWGAWGCA